jgi:hypothetical protein
MPRNYIIKWRSSLPVNVSYLVKETGLPEWSQDKEQAKRFTWKEAHQVLANNAEYWGPPEGRSDDTRRGIGHPILVRVSRG